MHRSQDGGKNQRNGGHCVHTEPGELRRLPRRLIDPKDPKRYITVDDGGASINTSNGPRDRFPTARYHVHVDNRVLTDLQQPAGRRDDARARDEL